MSNLLINIDHVATLRNARREAFPDPIEAARLCEASGADGIVFHLREDRRHINDDDVAQLKRIVRGKLDFELSTDPTIVDICRATRPDLATLVPERREEITTEGGLDVVRHQTNLQHTVSRLRDAGIREVALFVDPDPDQIRAARDTGATSVELHTGDFANAREPLDRALEMNRRAMERGGMSYGTPVERAEAKVHQNVTREVSLLAEASQFAHSCGLIVHAGHGLNYDNYSCFARSVPHISEVSIGFSVIARSIFVGLGTAVAEMVRLVKGQHES